MNTIGHLTVDNVRVTEHVHNAEAVHSLFDNLLGSVADRSFTLDLDYLGLLSFDLQHIDGVFTEEEAWTAIKDMSMDWTK
jgi:hypothetical protein